MCRWEFELITPMERLAPNDRNETLDKVCAIFLPMLHYALIEKLPGNRKSR